MIGKLICKIPFFGSKYRIVRKRSATNKNLKYYSGRFFKHTLTYSVSQESMRSEIIMDYHIIEKGLTMPEKRKGFGQAVVARLISGIRTYINQFGLDDCSVQTGVAVLKEYYIEHESNPVLEDDLQVSLKEFLGEHPSIERMRQYRSSREQFFENVHADFEKFAKSRHSVRNLSGETTIDDILDAVAIAMQSPSSCNRQPWKVHLVCEKQKIVDCLQFQNGNRGFTHLINKLIIVTVDARSFGHTEMNDVYVNGGLFSMSLAYALHYKKIGSCMLNWSVTEQNDMGLRQLLNIPDWEMIIVMIGCGKPPDYFESPLSLRKNYSDIIFTH